MASYLAEARTLPLNDLVVERAKIHILDTVAAVVSGSQMLAGRRAKSWLEVAWGATGLGPCTVLGHGGSGSAFAAALCNGMAAHADETDDSHGPSLSHPGCAVVPAALAASEEIDGSGEDLIRSVIVGYDIGCRVGRATRGAHRDRSASRWSSHSVVGTLCAATAVGVLYGFGEDEARYLLSYASQLSSGTNTWLRDVHHVEAAFVLGGMAASHGVLAASLVRAGCDGVDDVFTGSPNWLDAMSASVEREWLVWALGEEFEILHATIKKYAVGSPAQAAVEAVVELIATSGLSAAEVDEVIIRLPSDTAVIVDGRVMPMVNVQYLVAGTLLDARFSAQMSHDGARMREAEVVAMIDRIRLVADDSIAHTRSAIVVVKRRGDLRGEVLSRTVTDVRGTPASPMSWSEVRSKAEDLMGDVLGPARTRAVCDLVRGLDRLDDVAALTTLCVPTS
jgi:2-methylcitrate dehydratase PrpD